MHKFAILLRVVGFDRRKIKLGSELCISLEKKTIYDAFSAFE